MTMNLDDFFGDDESQNVTTLIAVTKNFLGFVSQLAEIVDDLANSFTELSTKVDSLLQNPGAIAPSSTPAAPAPTAPAPTAPSAPPTAPTAPSAPPTAPTAPSAPPPIPTAPSAAPAGFPGLPTPPAPAAAPSGLPPLPGLSPAPQPGFGQPPAPQPGFGQPPPASSGGGFQGLTKAPPRQAPRAQPMNLKAQMNSELKEAFARIKKGWSEDDE
ncbi:MAG: hypothetical protein ACXADY_00560 [Candidatus Hodarchaeales archaeon]